MTKTLNTCRLAIYGTIQPQRALEHQSPPTLAIYGERPLVGLLTDRIEQPPHTSALSARPRRGNTRSLCPSNTRSGVPIGLPQPRPDQPCTSLGRILPSPPKASGSVSNLSSLSWKEMVPLP